MKHLSLTASAETMCITLIIGFIAVLPLSAAADTVPFSAKLLSALDIWFRCSQS